MINMAEIIYGQLTPTIIEGDFEDDFKNSDKDDFWIEFLIELGMPSANKIKKVLNDKEVTKNSKYTIRNKG